jgi:hypothetical protein
MAVPKLLSGDQLQLRPQRKRNLFKIFLEFFLQPKFNNVNKQKSCATSADTNQDLVQTVPLKNSEENIKKLQI